jgi:biotin operon repressor
MQINKQTIAVGLAAAALAAGTGIAVSQANSDNALPSNGAAGQGGPGGMRGGPGGDRDLSGLAKSLGVSEAKLEAAMQNLRPNRQPGASGQQDMAAALAKALGLSESKVKAALEANRPDGAQGGPPAGGAPPSGATAPAPNATSSSSDTVQS